MSIINFNDYHIQSLNKGKRTISKYVDDRDYDYLLRKFKEYYGDKPNEEEMAEYIWDFACEVAVVGNDYKYGFGFGEAKSVASAMYWQIIEG